MADGRGVQVVATRKEGTALRGKATGGGRLTPRGERTKAGLLVAARKVFERDGFLDARITDIAAEAEVAHGTFYTYFDSKEAIFREVVESLQADFHEPLPRQPDDTPYDQILRANRRYYDIYASRARILGIFESVATFNDELLEIRRGVRGRFTERVEGAIRRWQAAGTTDPELDAHYAASALGSMVDRSVYLWTVLGEPHDPDVAIETLSRLWAHALGLAVPDKKGRRRRAR